MSQESGKQNIKYLLISATRSSPVWNRIGPPDELYLEKFCKFISSFDDVELKAIGRDTAESMVQNPELCCNILLSFLLKPT
ncbi:MAG: hypothetical protein ACRD5B_19065 [Nitrososphaeraceae archaeon]